MNYGSVSRVLAYLSRILLGVLILAAPGAGLAQEAASDSGEKESTFSGGGELDFNTRYIWHGIALSEGPVLQPSAWLTVADFTFSPWANYDLEGPPRHGQFTELDLSFGYAREWKDFSLEAGYLHYLYPHQHHKDAPDTGEVSLSLAYALGSFSFFCSNWFDVVEYQGSYFGEYGVGYEKELEPGLTLEATAYVGAASPKFNEVNLEWRKGAFNLVGSTLNLIYYPIETFYLRPHVEFTSLLDPDLSFQVDDSNILNLGVAIGKEF